MAENLVVMEDGRELNFGARAKMLKNSEIVDGAVVSTFDFANGKTFKFTCSAEDMLNNFICYGVDQKFGDEIAGIKEVEDCYLAIESLAARLEQGIWSKVRESNGMAGTSILIQALVEHSGKPVEAIKGFLKDKTQAQKLALRNNQDIKPIVDRLEAAKVAKKPGIDTDALLAEL